MKPSESSSSKTPEIVITDKILADIKAPFRGLSLVERAIVILAKYTPKDSLQQAIDSPQNVRSRALYYLQNEPTYRGDAYFVERVWCKAIEDASNLGGKGLFRLSFPAIEILIIS